MRKIIIFLISCLIIASIFANPATPKMPVNLLITPNLPQNAAGFTPSNLPLDKPLLSPAQATAAHNTFLQRYYYPWSAANQPTQICLTADGNNCKPVLGLETQIIATFKKEPGLNNNYQANSPAWINAIAANMQLNTFPNVNCKNSDMCHGIAVNNTYIRAIPTMDPSYSDITQPGQAYPFDNIQASALWLGTPVMVLQQSKDHKWLLIKVAGDFGWVEAKNIAFTSTDFMKQWQSHTLVTPIALKATLDPNLTITQPKTLYLGSFFPYISKFTYDYLIQLPIANQKQQAETVEYYVSNNFVTKWPLATTPQNFNRLINQFLGMPYGWGDIEFHSDCSSTMQRLFGAFGIWLPRNAKPQLDFGGYIHPLPLSSYASAAARQASLVHGDVPLKPYLTLIGFGNENNGIGHVALYLGKYPKNNPQDLIIFQSVWGAEIKQGNVPVGRAIIGKAAITTMSFANHLDLGNTGYTISGLWQIPGIYVTDLLEPQNNDWLEKEKIGD